MTDERVPEIPEIACELTTLLGNVIKLRIHGAPFELLDFRRPAPWEQLYGEPPDSPGRSPYQLIFKLETVVGRRAYYREVPALP